MTLIIDKNKCTGCKLCGDVCTQNAVSFAEGKDGCWFPEIDDSKCSHCGLCEKKCPALNIVKAENYNNPKVFAAWSVNDDIRYDSTSGGIYYEIAKAFIESGGYIAGCVFSDDYKSAMHIVGNTMDDLRRIMGSKYFQSDTAGIYNKIKYLLSQGEKVLFCGTPCQAAAVKAFLGRQTENLYLLDFICKGINSPKAYRAYISELEKKYGSPVKTVRQKSKKTGWQSLATNIVFQNGREYHKDRYTDWWIQGYTCGNLFMRASCEDCPYKELPRLADLSFGDFWGINGCSDEDLRKGISVILVNSLRGSKLLKMAYKNIHLEERTLDDVIKGNPYLFGQAVHKGNREKFFELLDEKEFSTAVKEVYTESFVQKIKRYAKLILKRVFKRKKW